MLRGVFSLKPVALFRKRQSFASAAAKKTIGFIGVGNMGKGMAKNLIDKGHSVVAYDLNADILAEAVKNGAQAAHSVSDLASRSSIIVTMLPNNAAVMSCYTGSGGVLEKVSNGSLLIDSSTIDPAVCKTIAQDAAAQGAVFVDAPVSGGVMAAAGGTLTFMVGAETQQHFQTAKAILEDMGKTIIHCGPVGTGQVVKICNNMLLAISMIGVSETMNLGVNLGMDPKLLASILSSATGRCWSMDTYNPVPGVMPNVPSSNGYKGGFGSSLMLKDLGLAQDAASRSGSATPLGSLALQIYRMMCNSEYSDKDFSAAYQFLRRK